MGIAHPRRLDEMLQHKIPTIKLFNQRLREGNNHYLPSLLHTVLPWENDDGDEQRWMHYHKNTTTVSIIYTYVTRIKNTPKC